MLRAPDAHESQKLHTGTYKDRLNCEVAELRIFQGATEDLSLITFLCKDVCLREAGHWIHWLNNPPSPLEFFPSICSNTTEEAGCRHSIGTYLLP